LAVAGDGVEDLVGVLVHTNGRGLSFQVSIQAWIELVSSATERWVPRRSHLVVSSANQRSTRFSQVRARLAGQVACARRRWFHPSSGRRAGEGFL
jgi:hypothetical protein